MKKQIISMVALATVAGFTISSCKKDSKSDETVTTVTYNTSDEVASSNLVAKFSFENALTDAKGNITNGTSANTSFIAGAKGQAFQGSDSGYVLYTGVGSAISGLKSVTISAWVKTSPHNDGAESWFQLLNDSNWIGNMFILQESGTAGNDSTRIKFKVDSWNASAWKEQWIDLDKSRIAIGNDTWHHVVCSYNATTSKAAVYVDGKNMNIPATIADRTQDDPTKGGVALGELAFKNATRFVFGCYNQSLPGNSPDAWMKNFNGGLDEFRIYNKALADADVTALYDLEKAGK
jgi:hypothetical protein